MNFELKCIVDYDRWEIIGSLYLTFLLWNTGASNSSFAFLYGDSCLYFPANAKPLTESRELWLFILALILGKKFCELSYYIGWCGPFIFSSAYSFMINWDWWLYILLLLSILSWYLPINLFRGRPSYLGLIVAFCNSNLFYLLNFPRWPNNSKLFY